MQFKGSPQQEMVWAEIQNSTNHIIIEALAGTGKTTTILESLRLLPPPNAMRPGSGIAFVAFNKSIAQELQQRVPKGVHAMTLHQLGFAAVRKAFHRVTVDRDKCDRMLPDDLPRQMRQPILKLVGLCKGNVLSGSNAELGELVDMFDMDIDERDEGEVFEHVRDIIRQSKEMTHVVDFDDMIWLPVVLGLPVDRFATLCVDEAQDLNKAQQEICMASGRRLIVVGDRHQAIYAFRGADSTSMDTMRARLSPNVTVLPLTVTRRCPQSVVSFAKKLVPTFEAPEDAPIGEVVLAHPERDKPVVGDMVVCRTNAPLMSEAFRLLQSDTPVRIQGRDIGSGLASLIRRIVAGTASAALLLERVDTYEDREMAKLRMSKRSSAKDRMEQLHDKCDCIRYLAEGLDTVQQVLNRIEVLFADTPNVYPLPYVLLSSVHRAKGMEANTVHIIRPELMPHSNAKTVTDATQEKNILYVAITRAKKRLVLHGTPNMEVPFTDRPAPGAGATA